MWLAPKDRRQVTAEYFDSFYREEYKGLEKHVGDILELTGSLQNLHVLDLGGGPLAGVLAKGTKKYTLVDFSEEAGKLIKKGFDAPHLLVVVKDALKFLQDSEHLFLFTTIKPHYDLCMCFGLAEYLPAGSLDTLFRLIPSKIFCFGTASAESYLQYPARLVCYSGEDVNSTATKYGWKNVKQLPLASHTWVRFEKA